MRRFAIFPLSLLAFTPSLAFAGGTAVIAPLVPTGVDSKISNNLTSLLSSELDFSGAYDTVTELSSMPSTMNTSCLSSTSCLGGIAKQNGVDMVIAGGVGSGGSGLKINLVLYDAKKNAIVRKKAYDIAADVGTQAAQAPKMVKEILGQGAPPAEQQEKATAAAAAAFSDDDEGFDFEDEPKSDIKGKTAIQVERKAPGVLEDEIDEAEVAAEAAQAKAAADAKKKAEAAAKAKAEAEAKAKVESAARAKAEAAAKAKAEAAARAQAEEDEAQAEAEARAAAATKAKSTKSKPSTSEEADLEAELAAFSFGGGGSADIVIESEDDTPDEIEVEAAAPSSSGGTFSSRYASSSSAKAAPVKTAPTLTTRTVVEDDDDLEAVDNLDEDLEVEEETPRSSSRTSEDDDDSAGRSSSRSTFEEEEEEEEAPRFSSRSSEVEEDEEEESPRYSSRKSSDEEDEDEPSSGSSRRTYDDDDDRASKSRSTAALDKARFGLAARAGYSRYGNLNFVNYGVEAEIPVAARVLILLGIEGASTNRNYTDKEREVIAESAGIDPTQVQDWNAILPINLGFIYKAMGKSVQPYVGADGVAVMYTSTPDFAFGGRARVGVDFMVAENFGFNLDLGIGVLAGDQFDAIQKDLSELGFYPEVSGGTLLVF